MLSLLACAWISQKDVCDRQVELGGASCDTGGEGSDGTSSPNADDTAPASGADDTAPAEADDTAQPDDTSKGSEETDADGDGLPDLLIGVNDETIALVPTGD